MCNQDCEAPLHIFCQCAFAKECWNRLGLGWCLVNATLVLEWLAIILLKIDSSRWGGIAALCWGLWRHKNQVAWDNKRDEACSVVVGALSQL